MSNDRMSEHAFAPTSYLSSVGTMSDRAMLILLQEWHRQLMEAFETAKAAFPDPEPERNRIWTNPFPLMFRAATENDPPNQWQWVETGRTPPHLLDLETTIDRIGAQIDELKGA